MKLNKTKDNFSKKNLPLNIQLARKVDDSKLNTIVFVESSFHQTSLLESPHFYKPISRMAVKNE